MYELRAVIEGEAEPEIGYTLVESSIADYRRAADAAHRNANRWRETELHIVRMIDGQTVAKLCAGAWVYPMTFTPPDVVDHHNNVEAKRPPNVEPIRRRVSPGL